MKIRRYRKSDQEEVWALHNLALEEAGAHAGNGPWDDDLRHIREVYLNDGGEFIVGIHEGRLVALGALKRISGERAEIKRMRVHPQFQSRGYGREILQRLESRANELGYVTLRLDTTAQQLAAQRLYTQSGYAEIERTKVSHFDVIFYEKSLSPR